MARPAGGSGPGRAAFAARLGLTAVGALAQLVERLLCKQEVTGSRPVGSTSGTPVDGTATVVIGSDHPAAAGDPESGGTVDADARHRGRGADQLPRAQRGEAGGPGQDRGATHRARRTRHPWRCLPDHPAARSGTPRRSHRALTTSRCQHRPWRVPASSEGSETRFASAMRRAPSPDFLCPPRTRDTRGRAADHDVPRRISAPASPPPGLRVRAALPRGIHSPPHLPPSDRSDPGGQPADSLLFPAGCPFRHGAHRGATVTPACHRCGAVHPLVYWVEPSWLCFDCRRRGETSRGGGRQRRSAGRRVLRVGRILGR